MENTMNKNVSSSIIDQEKGFTLIELCIVIIIIGVLVAPLLQLYHSYLLRKEMIITRENVQTAVNGLSLVLNRYPCPSDRSLAPGAANFGIEQCDLATIPLCSTPGLQGICRTTSAFDRDASGANDEVIIGGVPLFYYQVYDSVTGAPDVSTIENVPYMQGSTVHDGWNNRLTYAVTANVTRPNRLPAVIQRDFKAGVISALDENGNPTAGISNNALFVVVSHGKDGQGAFNNAGVSFDNCSLTSRGENCDEDTTFMQGIALSDGTGGGTPPFTGPFDDISKFFIIPEGELWRPTGETDAYNRPLPHIRTMNNNNVGVNITGTPTSKLEVGGTIRADSVRASNICDENGNNCFNPPTLFGSGMPISAGSGSAGVCDVGQVITGISNGQIQCGRPSFSVPPAAVGGTRACPVSKYIVSVLTNGCIVCNDGSKVCS